MRCKYVYTKEDKEVLEGKVNEGDRCTSNYAPPDPNHEYKGNCSGHARRLASRGLLTIHKNVKKGEGKAMVKAGSNIAKKSKGNKYIEDLARLTEEGFNAIEAYEMVKKINPYPQVKSGAEKYLFAMWLLSAQDTREPATQSEFAQLTGVSITQLELWRVGDELLDLFDDHRKSFMVRKGHMVDLKLLAEINKGSLKAMEMYYNMFPVSKREVGGKGQGVPKKVININQAVLMEAEESKQERTRYGKDPNYRLITNPVAQKMEDKAMIAKMKEGE